LGVWHGSCDLSRRQQRGEDMSSLKQQINQEVVLCLEDVACPEVEIVLAHLMSEVRIVGKIKFFSAGGNGDKEYAIVEASGVTVPLVIPLDRLRLVNPGAESSSRLGDIEGPRITAAIAGKLGTDWTI